MTLEDAAALADSVRVQEATPGIQDAETSAEMSSLLRGRTEHPGVMIDLTLREQDILGLLAQRLTNAEIAEHLFIGRRTVDSHVGHLLAKLDAPNRRQAVAIAARLGLI